MEYILSVFHIGVANAAFWRFNAAISDFLGVVIFTSYLILFLVMMYFMVRK